MSSLLLPLRDIWRTPKKFERDQQPDTQPFVLSRSYSCLQAYIRRDCGKIAIAYCEKEECEKREKKKGKRRAVQPGRIASTRHNHSDFLALIDATHLPTSANPARNPIPEAHTTFIRIATL